MKDITLKMTGRQCFPDSEEDMMEFITDGKLYEKDGATYIVYDETEVSGMAGCKTTLKITDTALRMKRIGNVGFGAELYFEKGRRFNSIYQTPYGPMGVEILTKAVDAQLDEEKCGKVDIEYDVSMEGASESKNRLTIDIS